MPRLLTWQAQPVCLRAKSRALRRPGYGPHRPATTITAALREQIATEDFHEPARAMRRPRQKAGAGTRRT